MQSQLLDGRYEIEQSLGAGGFGQTFIAKDRKMFDAICVVKLLKPASNDPQTLELARRMFAAEARLLHDLGNHDRIPRLFASFEAEQNFYLVQEYVQGHPLNEELIAGVQLPAADVITLVNDILEPLAYVHQQNVIHRDIKPANLMRRASDGKIVLIDFGSVKQIQTQIIEPDGHTRRTVAIGTYGYMPTEQGAGAPELSSDLYSVGMIAIQALTGIIPKKLTRNSDREICWQNNVAISTEFADAIDKMIRYDCRQRYQSAVEALAVFKVLVGNNEVTSPINEPLYHPTVINQAARSEAGKHLYTPTSYAQPVVPEEPITQIATAVQTEEVFDPAQAIAESDRSYKNGFTRLEQGDMLGAIEQFDRAIKYNPNNWKIYQERGKIFQMMRRSKEAEEDFQIANIKRGASTKPNSSSQQHHNLTNSAATSNVSVLQNVRNTLTRPIEGARTLGVTVFGPRGVGKTSLLAAMYDRFGQTTAGTSLQLTAELATAAILQDYVTKLKSPFNSEARLEITPGIQGTAEPQDFIFDLGRAGGPASIKLHFKDFPGGRIGANARNEEILEVKSLLTNCTVVLVVIDAPALMEENGKWNDLVNKPALITDYFKAAYQNLKSPHLVLLVPSKCEKYIQSDPNLLLAKVKSSYAPLLNFFAEPSLLSNVVVAVTPVQTLGNMVLTTIETQTIDGQLYPRYCYQRTANFYSPKDSEQPLRYLLNFLLKIHLQDRTFISKAIRSVIGELFEDTSFKSAVKDFTRQCKTSKGFAVLQDTNKWLNL